MNNIENPAIQLKDPLNPDHPPEQIIFPLVLSVGTFNTSAYRPEMTNNKLTQKDIEAFFEKVSTGTDHFKKVKPSFVIKRICTFVLVFLILFGCILGALSFISPSSIPNQHVWMLVFIILGIVLTIVFFVSLVVCNCVIVVQNKNLRKKLQEIIVTENKRIDEIGLRWQLPRDHFNWLELWIENKSFKKSTMTL